MTAEAFLVAALVVLVFGRAVRGPFLFDDPAMLEWDFHRGWPLFIHKPNAPSQLEIFRRFFWRERGLYHLVCRWLHLAAGGSRPEGSITNLEPRPQAWHLANLAVHLLNVWLFYRLVSFWRPDLALVAAAVFAFHPIQVASVCYISGLAGMLAVLFTLSGIIHFQLGGGAHLALAGLSHYLACKSKQEGYLFLLFYPIYFFFFG